MKMSRAWTAFATMALAGASHAALVDRGGGMIYDSTLNITWLADWNYAKTSGFDADGLLDWTTANAWANSLIYGGFDDWRLPIVKQPDTSCSANFDPGGGFQQQFYGYNCTGSEMGHLFYDDLGGIADGSILDYTSNTPREVANRALFKNVNASFYWSGSEYVPLPSNAWTFRTSDGTVVYLDKALVAGYALVVRPGDVPTSVPEPQTLALIIVALGATLVVRNSSHSGPRERPCPGSV